MLIQCDLCGEIRQYGSKENKFEVQVYTRKKGRLDCLTLCHVCEDRLSSIVETLAKQKGEQNGTQRAGEDKH